MELAARDIDLVRQCMLEDAGLLLEADKDYLVETRLVRLARQQELTVAELLARLRQAGRGPLRQAVVDNMAIKETYFFRDPWLYESLQQSLLPDLLRRHANRRTLRLWCAAAATGQEIYSICMFLREHFPELAGWELTLVASDFSATALEQAAAGRYSMPEVNRGLPARLLTRYFRRVGLEWEISDDIRKMVDFRAINLVSAWPLLPPFDLVLVRNVLIYFAPDKRRNVLRRLRGTMEGDGYLLLGGGETPPGADEGFLPLAECRGAYRAVGGVKR